MIKLHFYKTIGDYFVLLLVLDYMCNKMKVSFSFISFSLPISVERENWLKKKDWYLVSIIPCDSQLLSRERTLVLSYKYYTLRNLRTKKGCSMIHSLDVMPSTKNGARIFAWDLDALTVSKMDSSTWRWAEKEGKKRGGGRGEGRRKQLACLNLGRGRVRVFTSRFSGIKWLKLNLSPC